MARDCPVSQQVLRAQEDMFRIACDPRRPYGMSLRTISTMTGCSYNTVRGWAGHNGEPHEMPVSAIRKLQLANFPNELLSMLLADDSAIVKLPDGIDHDEAANAMVDYIAHKQQAHHPDSECGPALGPTEKKTLCGKLSVVASAAQ